MALGEFFLFKIVMTMKPHAVFLSQTAEQHKFILIHSVILQHEYNMKYFLNCLAMTCTSVEEKGIWLENFNSMESLQDN